MTTYCIDIFHNSNGTQHGTNQPNQAVSLIQATSFSNDRDTGLVTASTAAYQEAGRGRAAWLANKYGPIVGIANPALTLAQQSAQRGRVFDCLLDR